MTPSEGLPWGVGNSTRYWKLASSPLRCTDFLSIERLAPPFLRSGVHSTAMAGRGRRGGRGRRRHRGGFMGRLIHKRHLAPPGPPPYPPLIRLRRGLPPA